MRPGVQEVLEELSSLRTGGRAAVVVGLLSDFHMPSQPSDVPAIFAEYYALLDGLGISRFFEPLSRRVTLSTEVGRRPSAVPRPSLGRPSAGPRLTWR